MQAFNVITCPFLFSVVNDPCCHANKIWDKIGYNTPSTRDILRSLHLTWGFGGQAIRWD